jgi:hypothetical protein
VCQTGSLIRDSTSSRAVTPEAVKVSDKAYDSGIAEKDVFDTWSPRGVSRPRKKKGKKAPLCDEV